jgi:hypothetical protein
MAVTRIATSSLKTLNKYDSFLGGNAYYVPPSFESIATTTVGAGGASTITFSSIPSTYKHLQIRLIGKNTRAATDDATYMYYNGDNSSTLYSLHYMYGDGATKGAGGLTDRNEMYVLYITSANATANYFGAAIIDILDYANTNKYKTMRQIGGEMYNSSANGAVAMTSGLWRNTAAINSITFFGGGSIVFSQYTQIALYGIKG